MNKADIYMKEAIENILTNGYLDENPRPKYSDGTPAHTLSVNHIVRQYDLSKGEFPITSLRPIAWKSAIKEILWIYQDASNDLNVLRDKYNVHYWDLWESKDIPNTIGKRYGYIVRKYDLMNKLLKGLKENSYGRRQIIDLYQYEDLEDSDGLYPCAFLTIWNVRKGKDNKEYLDMSLIQRSGDSLAASCSGVNEVQYPALMMMVARHCGYEVGMFTHFVANEQLYTKHIEQARELVKRFKKKSNEESELISKLISENHINSKGTKEYLDYLSVIKESITPKLILNPEKTNFYDFTIDDFTMENYEPVRPQLELPLGI